jgi:hypothetical protein
VTKDAPGSSPVNHSALSTAVALLTRRTMPADITTAEVLGDQAPEAVLEALEVIAEVCLERLFPADCGADVLQDLGEIAALHAARQAATDD